MRSKLLLRLAAVLVLVHLLGHAAGHLGWDHPEDGKMQAVVNTMKSYSANFMGATKSMADYYNGYSLMTFGLFGLTIFILWFASGFIETHRAIARKVLLPLGVVYLYFGITEFIYFFPFAASMSFLAGLLTMFAALQKK